MCIPVEAKAGSFVDPKYMNFYAKRQNENKSYWKTKKPKLIHKPLWLTSKGEQHSASTHMNTPTVSTVSVRSHLHTTGHVLTYPQLSLVLVHS